MWASNDRTVVVESITRNSVPAMRAKSSKASRPTAVDMAVWCAAPAVSHAVAEVAKSGAGFQTGTPAGSFWRRGAGGTDPALVADKPDPAAHVGQADDDPGAGIGGEAEADGVLAAADGEGVNL